MEYVQMTLNDWLDMKQKLKMELQGVKQSFVRIGYALRKIDDQKLYEQDGYKSIAEFAKAEYGLEASTVSRFMSINREYSIDGYSEHLREEYLDMGRSQLEEMLKLPEKDREMIRPETPRQDIRDLKNFNKTEPAAGVADDLKELIRKFFEDNPDTLDAVFKEEADFQDTLERKIEVVNPSGNRSYKKGLFFLMMYEDNIKIKKFGMEPQTMSWKDFFAVAAEIKEEMPEVVVEVSPEATVEVTQEITVADAEENTVQEQSEVVITSPAKEEPVKNEISQNEELPKKWEKPAPKQEEKIAPAQLKKPENTMADTDFVTPKIDPEEQVPGQQEITEYTEVIPEGVVIEPTPKKRWNRKDYLDNCTEYGAALYFYRWFKDESEAKDILTNVDRLEEWMKESVNENGQSET